MAQSLAQFLQVDDPRTPDAQAEADLTPSEPTLDGLVDVSDPKEFCRRVLESREFRQYIMNGIVLGDLPAAIMTRVMDHGWGKPPEKHEHTGANGEPIKTVTEVRRVIVRPRDMAEALEADLQTDLEEGIKARQAKVTH